MSETAPTTLPAQEQVTSPIQSPEAANRALRQAEEAERAKLIEKQLDTEALLSGLGAVGIGRLRHPFRNARIIFTAARRQTRGEYSPRLTQPTEGLGPFDDDPQQELINARRQRQLIAEQSQRHNPFEDTPEDEAYWAAEKQKRDLEAIARAKEPSPFD